MRPNNGGKVWRKAGRNGREGTMPARPWLVFYVNGARIGSVPATRANRQEAHRLMRLSLIQRDVTGTENYAVLGLAAGGAS